MGVGSPSYQWERFRLLFLILVSSLLPSGTRVTLENACVWVDGDGHPKCMRVQRNVTIYEQGTDVERIPGSWDYVDDDDQRTRGQ